MSIGRVTHSGMTSAADRNIQAATQRLAAAQQKASTLKSISRPSDNPADAAAAMSVRSQQRANVQFTRNANDAQSWLATADTALSTTSTLLNRARQLVTSGANEGMLGPEAREALAVELDSLREALLDTANTTYMGRHVFAGTSNAETAFDDDGKWLGTGNSTVERRVGPNTTVRVDADGERAFGSGDNNVFVLLDGISADLRAGKPVAHYLDDLQQRHSAVLSVQASVGAAHATVLRAEDSLRADHVMLETRRSGLEDADLAEVALELQTAEVAYQASLMTTSRVLQTSLMDYLR